VKHQFVGQLIDALGAGRAGCMVQGRAHFLPDRPTAVEHALDTGLSGIAPKASEFGINLAHGGIDLLHGLRGIQSHAGLLVKLGQPLRLHAQATGTDDIA
jgi:hypothetical protein